MEHEQDYERHSKRQLSAWKLGSPIYSLTHEKGRVCRNFEELETICIC